jgi:uncharacterized protein (TIGR02231 family)
MQIVNSQINSVTVFPNIATITRVASATLEAGENLLVFDLLPPTVIEKSVQLKGFGNAVLGTVKFERVPFVDEPNVTKSELQGKIQSAEDEVRTSDDKLLRLSKEKAFMDGIAQKLTTASPESDGAELDPDKWVKMIAFYNEKLEALDKQVRAAEKEKRKHTNQLENLKLNLEKAGTPQSKKMKVRISCIVHTVQEGEILLELSYNVPGAQWYPLYDIRVSSDRKLNITYQAVVYQTTGEDWENASLKISTAQPRTHGYAPELSPWRLELHGSEDFEAPVAARMSNKPAGGGTGALAQAPMPEAMKKPAVIMETGATSVSFVIAGNHTVKADGSDSRVTILTENFNSHFNYTTIPVLQPYAYLKAKIMNHTDVPLLPGDANVFLDGNFVTISRIPHVSPTQEFTVSLGVDESFKITREKVKIQEKEGGNLFSKKTTLMLHEYKLKISNYKKTAETIAVWDQYPLSSTEQIKVHLIEPVIRENTNALKKNDLGYIEWILTLKAGEELTIPVKFSVEFPTEYRDRILI